MSSLWKWGEACYPSTLLRVTLSLSKSQPRRAGLTRPAPRVIAVMVLLALGACRSSTPTPSSTTPTVVIRPVPLPDLGTAAAPVQEMLRQRHDAVERASTSPTPDPARARAYGELGMLLMAAEYFPPAEIALQDAEALAPGEMRWPYYLGHLYQRTGEATKATAAFERAVKADGSYPPALVYLGNAYLDEGRSDAADPLYDKALMLDSRFVFALLGKGRAALARNDYATAITQLERGLAIDPDARALHPPLALAYRGAGQADKARAHLLAQGTAPLRPPDPIYEEVDLLLETPVAYELRGGRALSAGRYEEAVTAFRKGVALDPNEPALRHKLATALALTGDLHGALMEMRETVRRSPTFAKGHYSLAVLYLQANDYRRAAASFEDALKVEPAYVEPRLQLAHLLRRTGQSAAALPQYMKVIELDPRIAEARFGYAMALVDLRRFVEARDRLLQDTQAFPEYPGFVIALSRILAAAPDAAARDGQRAVAAMQALPTAAQHTLEFGIAMAMAFAEVARFQEAVDIQQQVISQLPSGGDPRFRQGLSESLRSYQERRPLRQPWLDGEPMELSDPIGSTR